MPNVHSGEPSRLFRARPARGTVNPLPRWRLRRVREFVVGRIGERITLPELAAAAGLSRMHFAAQFRAATGLRPHDWVLRRRIEFAKAAIAEENMPLAEVALCAGFQTQSHFSTVFKHFTGDTPGEWRRRQRLRPVSLTPFVAIPDNLARKPRLPREDVVVSLVEVKENWSFANGVAQYAAALPSD